MSTSEVSDIIINHIRNAQYPHNNLLIGSSLVDQEPERSIFPKGATATKIVMGSGEQSLRTGLKAVDAITISPTPDHQHVWINSSSKLMESLSHRLFPSSDALNMGVARILSADLAAGNNDGHGKISSSTTGYTNNNSTGATPSSASVSLLRTHGVSFLTPYSSIEGASSFTIPAGLTNGEENMFLGAGNDLHSYVSSLSSSESDLIRMMLSESASNQQAELVQRTYAQMLTGDAGDTATGGFELDSTQSFAERVLLKTTVSISPANDESPLTMKMKILSGSYWPGDCLIREKATGKFLRVFADGLDEGNMQEYVNDLASTPVFFKDFILDLSLYEITSTLTLESSVVNQNSLMIPAGEPIQVPITISSELEVDTTGASGTLLDALNRFESGTLRLYLPSGSGVGLTKTVLVDQNGDSVNIQLPDGTDRDVEPFATTVKFTRGTVMPQSYSPTPLTILPKGFKLDSKTTFSSYTNSNSYPEHMLASHRFSADYTILDCGFVVEGDAIIANVVGRNDQIAIKNGAVSLTPQAIVKSSTWDEPLLFSDLTLTGGHVAQGPIVLNNETFMQSGVVATNGSLVKKGSVLPAGITTVKGLKSTKDQNFTAGTPIQSDLDIKVPVDLTNGLDGGNNKISKGSTIYAISKTSDGTTFRTSLPTGFRVSNGNKLPSSLRVLTNESVEFEGEQVISNPTFGPGFILSNVAFESGWAFQANTQFSQNTTLPQGTGIAKGNKFSFEFPFPDGQRFDRGHKLIIGTRFPAGSPLPAIPLRSQEEGLRAQLVAGGLVPYLIVTAGSKSYVVWPSGTVFGRSASLPKGSVLLAASGFATGTSNQSDKSVWVHTSTLAAALSTDVYDSGAFVVPDSPATQTIDEGSFSFDSRNGAVSGNALVLSQGTPVAQPITFVDEWQTNYDIAIPLNDHSGILPTMDICEDLLINKEVTLEKAHIVAGDDAMRHPAGQLLPVDVTLATELRLPELFQCQKTITLPSYEGSERLIDGLFTVPDTWIKLPNLVNAYRKKMQILDGHSLTVGNGAGESKAYLEIPAGNEVKVAGGYYQLKSELQLENNWHIEQDLVSSPRFIVAGLHLVAGSKLPGTFSIGRDQQFPDGLTTTEELILSADLPICNENGSSFSIPSNASYAKGTKFAEESVFEGGCDLQNVSYGPVKLWNTPFGATIYQDEPISSAIKFNYFKSQSDNYYSYVVDNQAELTKIMDLLSMMHGH